MKKNILLLAFVVLTSLQLSAQTGDPWIKKVYNVTWGRNPTALEYNIYNYHNGQWNNYNELMNYIYEYQKNLYANGLSFKYSQVVNNQLVVGVFKNNSQIAVDLITNDGGSIVAQGGGNIISTNGGGIVAQGGGNIVAQGGGNIAVTAGVKGLSFGPSTTKVLAAGGMVIPTSGGSAFIIK